MSKALSCDGYMMFHGSAKVTPVIRSDGTRWKEPFFLVGTWLYKPARAFDSPEGCWYFKPDDGGFTLSYPADILSEFMDDDGLPVENAYDAK